MAAAAILKIAFLVITHQPIVRFQRNFVWGSRTACRQGLHDKNCKILKSKMADGRHFENRKIAISQWKIVRFWWNSAHYSKWWTRLHSLVTKNWNLVRHSPPWIFKIQGGGGRHLENCFCGHNSSTIFRFRRNFVWRNRMASRQRPHDKNCKLLQCKMADGRHFENR